MKETLIAPCGMNCALCVNFLAREHDINKKGFHKSYCPGCIPRGNHCTYSTLCARCRPIAEGTIRFCFECAQYPCAGLKTLNKRYSGKYHMSMLDNLEFINAHGMAAFLEKEATAWRCPTCGGTVCCHNGLCLACDIDTLRNKKTYRWGER